MSLVRTDAPKKEVIDLNSAKSILDFETDEKDTEIKDLIKEASELIEKECSVALYTQTWRYKIDDFEDEIKIPRPPLQSVTSIEYIDEDGITQTVDSTDYDVDSDSYPGVVRLGYNKSWPDHRNVKNAVTITFVAGYSTIDDVPKVIKRALKLQLKQMFDYPEMERETKVLDSSVKRLLASERIINL